MRKGERVLIWRLRRKRNEFSLEGLGTFTKGVPSSSDWTCMIRTWGMGMGRAVGRNSMGRVKAWKAES